MPKSSKAPQANDLYTTDRNFQAKLQIRPENADIDNFIKEQIRGRNDCFINKEEPHKYGIDYFLSSQKFARTLGKKLKEKFDGELTITSTLHGFDRRHGKEVHRITVCFRLKKERPAEEETYDEEE